MRDPEPFGANAVMIQELGRVRERLGVPRGSGFSVIKSACDVLPARKEVIAVRGYTARVLPDGTSDVSCSRLPARRHSKQLPFA
jgi:hypothetical protein